MHTPQPVPIVDDDDDDGSGGGNIDPDDDDGWSDDDEDDEDETLWTFEMNAGFTANVYRSWAVAAGERGGIR